MLDTTKMEEENQQNFQFPPIGQTFVRDDKLRVPSGRRSSFRLPSLGSIYESEHESFYSSRPNSSSDSAYDGMSPEFSSTSSFIERSDSFLSTIQTVVLEAEEEKEIEKRVRQEFRQEFQNIKMQTREKQKVLRKRFKSKINAARAKLLVARANAERETIDKLEKEAEKKETQILMERKKKRESKSAWELVADMAALRKIRAELDRARARRRSTIATTLVATRHKGYRFGGGLTEYEIKRLEKEDEIQKLVEELENLGLTDAANNLTSSLNNKTDSEEQLMINLKKEREQAKLKAQEKRNVEVERLRKEKIEEKEMLERERIKREAEERERLERERRMRMMEALRRKAFNIEMRKSLNQTKLTSRISRSYTYSYYDSQQF